MQNSNPSQIPTNRRRLNPAAKMSRGRWRLSEEDHEYLAIIAASPVEYVHDKKFMYSRAEKRFGQVAAPAADTIFSCFNYARFRVYRIFSDHAGGVIPLDEMRILLAWSRRADSLRNTIVKDNYPLVITMMTKNSAWNGRHDDEMVSDSNLALANSVNGFDENRLTANGTPIRFSTYSCRAILKALARAGGRVARQRRLFPVNYDPAMEKDDGDDVRREETVAYSAAKVLQIVRDNLADLSDKEERVIQERFFFKHKKKTLEEVGVLLNLSKERVRQIEAKAKAKIRGVLEPSL